MIADQHGRGLGGLGVPFVVTLLAIFSCTAPGRIVFPDDEIVFQTTRSLWEDGSLAIEGIPRRTGEPRGRPSGTFGWAEGVDGRRYGFFGHGLSIVALPMYGLGQATAHAAPEVWRHAIRSDHFFVHERSPEADFARLVVSLTNVILTAVAAWLLVVWTRLLGFSTGVCVATGLTYALGTTAWPYTRTFLSEPLSTVVLLGTVVCIARYHRARSTKHARAHRWLWLVGLLAGSSVHVHVLNVVAIPGLAIYALAGPWPDGERRRRRLAFVGAALCCAAGLALLGWSQWVRFGDPFETGRYGLYSHFVVPAEGLLAMLVAPGRSLFVYSPPLIVASLGWMMLWRRAPAVALTCAVLVVTRLLFVSARSDWWGGWAVGPRLLVPVVPFALVPIATVFARWRDLAARARVALLVVLAASVALQAWLSAHSIFEWMLRVYATDSPELSYLTRSHWLPDASPIVGFAELRPDMLLVGAVAIARAGHPGLLVVFTTIAIVGLVAGALLVHRLTRPHRR